MRLRAGAKRVPHAALPSVWLMRNAIVQVPDLRTEGELRRVLRVAVRQLERADLYLSAVMALEVGDPDAEIAIEKLRDDLEGLRRHLIDERARLAT
jgi:hypothetical protein